MNKKYIHGEPRVEFYDYLGHHFIYADRYSIRIYECYKCKMEAFIKIEDDVLEEIRLCNYNEANNYYNYLTNYLYCEYLHSSDQYMKLGNPISCDEYIIKNI